MREQRVDLAGIGGEVGLGQHLAAVVAGDLLEQALELVDIAIDGFAELGRAPVLAADLLEGLLALRRVEAAREDVALAALVAVPQFDGGVVVDEAGDVDRKRVERFDDALILVPVGRSAAAFFFSARAREHVVEPGAAALVLVLARLAGRFIARLPAGKRFLARLAARGRRFGARRLARGRARSLDDRG